MTLRSKDHVKILTVRTTAFDPDESSGGSAAEDKISADAPANSEWVGQELSKSDRPELASAKVVISGGRGMKTGDNFQGIAKDHLVYLRVAIFGIFSTGCSISLRIWVG